MTAKKGEANVWTVTIRIDGEADSLFDAVLQAIPEGYVVAVDHREFTGDAVFVAVGGRSITVRPYDPDTTERGEPVELDWAGLESIEVY